VNASSEETVESFQENAYGERLDFVYEDMTWMLLSHIKYSEHNAEHCLVSATLHFSQKEIDDFEAAPFAAQTQGRLIALGTSFVVNGHFFVMSASDGNNVTDGSTSSGEVITLSNAEIWQLVLSNIG
jgi:hypothetical protein